MSMSAKIGTLIMSKLSAGNGIDSLADQVGPSKARENYCEFQKEKV